MSIAESIPHRKTCQKTFDGIVMPRQLSQTWGLPFLGSFTINPLDQSSGIVSLSHMLWKRFVKTLVEVLRSALSISAWMLSIPQAFLLFEAMMACLTSSSIGGLMSMSKATSAGGGFTG